MATLKVPVSESDHIQNGKNASVTLVEYGDYQCPYCGMAYGVIKQVQEHFKKQLRFVFRNFPLTEVHPYAEMAAEAAEFAADHDKFWEMHDLIFENQKILSLPTIIELATSIELPIDALAAAIEKRAYHARIRKDFLGGAKSGVNGTPTFFINDQRHDGGFHLAELTRAIESAKTSLQRTVK